MTAKTDRILSHLPQVYQKAQRDSVIYTLMDVFGQELLAAENSLAGVMRAHWVDHADRGAEALNDLIRIGALYGLAPRPYESVEAFRAHLKRYIRTLLGSTVTVQGILRVAAEALDLPIADAYEELDSWWTRPTPELITVSPSRRDAAEVIFGVKSISVTGQPLQPPPQAVAVAQGQPETVASVMGTVDLSGGLDLSPPHNRYLRLALHRSNGRVDVAEIDLASHPGSHPLETMPAQQLVAAINSAVDDDLAELVVVSPEGSDEPETSPAATYIKLSLNEPWPDGRIEILSPAAQDATERVFGEIPRVHASKPAKPAQLIGKLDLSQGVDLSQGSRIWLTILDPQLENNGVANLPIYCGDDAADITQVKHFEIVTAINQVLQATFADTVGPIASQDGRVVTLTSPSEGFGSEIRLEFKLPKESEESEESSTGQSRPVVDPGNATETIFGLLPYRQPTIPARAAEITQPAVFTSPVDLSEGLELTVAAILYLGVDRVGLKEVPLRPPELDPEPDRGGSGSNPQSFRLLPEEIAEKINQAFRDDFGGAQIASTDGRYLTLRSPTQTLESGIWLGKKSIFSWGGGNVSSHGSSSLSAASGLSARKALSLEQQIFGSDFNDKRLGQWQNPRLDLTVRNQVQIAVNDQCVRINLRDSLTDETTDPAPVPLSEVRDGINEGLNDQGISYPVAQLSPPDHAVESIDPGDLREVLGSSINPVCLTRRLSLVAPARPYRLQQVSLETPDHMPTGEPNSVILAQIGTDYCIRTVDSEGRQLTDLQLMRLNHPEALPGEGQNLVIVAQVGPDFHLRIFDNQQVSKPDPIEADSPEASRLQSVFETFDNSFNPATIEPQTEPDLLQTISALGQLLKTFQPGFIDFTDTALTQSTLAIIPLETQERRQFVTRARVIDEAAQSILGFVHREATGTPPTPAQVTGPVDLRRGVDLRAARYLRIRVDDQPFVDVDCGACSGRQRAVTLDELVKAINRQLCSGTACQIAGQSDYFLQLTSPTAGADSQLVFEPPRAEDFLLHFPELAPGTVSGQAATGVMFVGTADLTDGIALAAGSAIRLAINGSEPVQILLSQAEATLQTAADLATTINTALQAENVIDNATEVASVVTDVLGTHLQLMPPGAGRDCQLSVLSPWGEPVVDVTQAILGVHPDRNYVGCDAVAATISTTISASLDLTTRRYLRLGLNGAPATVIDCSSQASQVGQATPEEICQAINQTLAQDIASLTQAGDAISLVLTAPNTDLASQLTLEPYTCADARALLLGAVADVTSGQAATSAQMTGEVDLLRPVDLSQRSTLRLALGPEAYPIDIDVAGSAPTMTFLDEIVEAINAVVPGLAQATEDDHLQLTAPATGGESYLAVLPLRHLELIDYPSVDQTPTSEALAHGDHWDLINANVMGAIDSTTTVDLKVEHDIIGPALVTSQDWQVRLFTQVHRGETIHLERHDQQGLQAKIERGGETVRQVPSHRILVGPPGTQLWVPCATRWTVYRNPHPSATLQLNNSDTPYLVLLKAISSDTPYQLDISVVRSKTPPDHEHTYFNVTIRQSAIPGNSSSVEAQVETYFNVTIGETTLTPHSLFYRLLAGKLDQATSSAETEIPETLAPSNLVIAERLHKREALTLPQGLTTWRFLEHETSRFGRERFEPTRLGQARFATVPCGGLLPEGPGNPASAADRCDYRGVFNVSKFNQAYFNGPDYPFHRYREQAVFGVSRFAARASGTTNVTADPVVAVLAPPPPVSPAKPFKSATVTVAWKYHQPGAFCVNLPAELPARFNPLTQPSKLMAFKQVEGLEGLVAAINTPNETTDTTPVLPPPALQLTAALVNQIPAPWRSVPVPCRTPRSLTWGSETQAARLYLRAPGEKGFVRLQAAQPGTAGNAVTVAVYPAGLGRYDLYIAYPEVFSQVVLEAGEEDDNALVTEINQGETPSQLVTAATVNRVPLGWEAVTVPCRKLQRLTLGNPDQTARLYLAEDGFDQFIELQAKTSGTWGNAVAVTVRRVGPALYDVAIYHPVVPPEKAEEVVLGPPLSRNPAGVLAPGPLGILQAKAAGVKATVSRNEVDPVKVIASR